ncbi:serine hydrolase domain-containing protein [Nitrospirillum iridis]|uniref:CubicO group peptidase (Beta-lactamase class C family) n=1 Tax=Nitrospirillum iridis TaxID=765888 RepID=A0A7X0ATE1_9PROT|nr:serine hydrolase domain-containing protein [Nitrospirillum iridis]MBB6249758.1 CubicO group peptidase (beta-lactamase class C family) [Nitrospirillum iridis]
MGIGAAVALTALPAVAMAQPKAVAASAAADPLAAQVDAFLQAQMRAGGIPGMQVAVIQHGRLVLSRSYGIANLQTPVPVTAETIFAVNSITKAFTGVAAMRQVQEGRLDLDAPVGQYLADLPAAWRPITIRQLLTHMSGLPDINRAPGDRDERVGGDAIWAWVQAQPMKFTPGERFDYCQTNYTLIQRVVDGLTGQPPDTPINGWEFEAAGMTHTAYGDSGMVTPGKAAGYRNSYAPGPDGAPVATPHPVYELFRPMHRASSGLDSTAEDMARWMIAVSQERLLDADSLRLLWTPARFNDGRASQWGLGWVVLNRGDHRAVGMTGGSRSAFFLYPEDDVGVVILTNLSGANPEDMIDQVAAFYGAKLTGVAALRAELQRRGYDQAAALYAELKAKDPAFQVEEAELNDWGYRLLSNGQPRNALPLLKLVADLFPASGNAQDSLAEALAATGDKAGAIVAYQRSLELDPKNTNAERRLVALKAGG